MTSILQTIRSALGLMEMDSFDHEIRIHINSALVILNQNGIGAPLSIEGVTETWDDLMLDPNDPEEKAMLGLIQQFVWLRTKLIFDPPPPAHVDSYKEAIKEALWRLREFYDGRQNLGA